MIKIFLNTLYHFIILYRLVLVNIQTFQYQLNPKGWFSLATEEEESERFHFFRFRLRLRRLRSAYDLVKARLSDSEAEAEG